MTYFVYSEQHEIPTVEVVETSDPEALAMVVRDYPDCIYFEVLPPVETPENYQAHFEALFRAVAACEPPEGSQLDSVLTEFQSTYEESVQ